MSIYLFVAVCLTLFVCLFFCFCLPVSVRHYLSPFLVCLCLLVCRSAFFYDCSIYADLVDVGIVGHPSTVELRNQLLTKTFGTKAKIYENMLNVLK